MNLKHGFLSQDPILNPDRRQLQAATLSNDDLVLAERFLHGDLCPEPVRAHEVVKVIFSSGKAKYPTLWDLAKKHADGYEFATLEKLSKLTS